MLVTQNLVICLWLQILIIFNQLDFCLKKQLPRPRAPMHQTFNSSRCWNCRSEKVRPANAYLQIRFCRTPRDISSFNGSLRGYRTDMNGRTVQVKRRPWIVAWKSCRPACWTYWVRWAAQTRYTCSRWDYLTLRKRIRLPKCVFYGNKRPGDAGDRTSYCGEGVYSLSIPQLEFNEVLGCLITVSAWR